MWRRQAIALLALAGVFDALYLLLYKLGYIGVLQCGSGACEAVQASRFATFLGFPVAAFGVAGYAALFVVSLLAARGAGSAPGGLDRLLALLASVGFVVTLYLTSLEAFAIHAFCRYCLGSAALSTAIWVLALPALRPKV